MVVNETLAHSNHVDMRSGYDPETHPIVCPICVNQPDLCAQVSCVVKQQYDEVNLNVDCPSEQVEGMREFWRRSYEEEGTHVCCGGFDAAQRIPLLIKCRVGVDEYDDWIMLHNLFEH